MECERELPKVLQAAVSEYAELSLGREAAAVRLCRTMSCSNSFATAGPRSGRWKSAAAAQDMVSLHALVVFDARMQQLIKDDIQRLVVGRRVQGAAVVFGGMLGLLALAWSGLKLATRRYTKGT